MTAKLRKSLIHFEIMAIVSLCGLLFIAALTLVGQSLWSIPAMILFALAGLTLLCTLPFVSALSRLKDVTSLAT
jgi:hypothetical protein